MKLLYLLLPDEDYRRVRANNDLLLKTKGQVDTGNPVEFEILDLRMTPASSLIIANDHVNHRVLRERLGSIQQIGYQAIISRDRDTGASQTTWARLVVLPLPETTTPPPTPSGAMGPNAISPDRIAAAPAERNHLRLAVGVDTTETTTVLVEYSRDDIAGDDNLSVRAGWRGEMIIGGTYQKDFAAFGFLGRRLTISVSGDSDFHPDRLIDNERHDERRNGGSASALLELFRDRQDHWLQFQTSLSRQDVKLKQNPTVPDKDTISRATLGLSYAWLRPYVIGTPLLSIDPSFSVARSDTNNSDFFETSVRAAFHAKFANFFEFDSRLGFDWASADTPEIELPRFGGEESVRGFRLEAASARLAWSLQNEVWFPLRFTDLLGSTMDGLLRRSLKLAAFIDIGGVEDSQQPVSAFEAGAGLGLRFTLQDQATLRIDWAHPLTDFASDLGGHTFYFSILLQPAHF